MEESKFIDYLIHQKGIKTEDLESWICTNLIEQGYFTKAELEKCLAELEKDTIFSVLEKNTTPYVFPAEKIAQTNEEIKTVLASPITPADTLGDFTLPTTKLALKNERYEVLEELGEGGMGVVQRVQDHLLGREVALKKVKMDSSQSTILNKKQNIMLWRLGREATLTSILEHPNIVPLYDLERKPNGEIYFTMRKVEGETLGQILREKREGRRTYEENKILSIFLKVCDAISYAHNQEVIHRDLKPANIMVGKFGEVYVMDWGIAKSLNEEEFFDKLEESSSSQEEEWKTIGGMGTPGYMAPEQKADAASVNQQADIFALGKILRECFTLFSPSEEFRELLKSYESSKTSSSNNFEKELEEKMPLDISAIVKKATEASLSERYQTVHELVDDIDRYRHNVKVSVRHYSPVELLMKFSQRNWKGLLIVVFILFVSLFFVFYSQWLKEKEREKQLRNRLSERQQRFQINFKKAQKARKVSDEIQVEGNLEKERKVELLLNALNYISRALALKAGNKAAEIEKLSIGKKLMALCYETQDYKLASYVAKEMGNLYFISRKEKTLLVLEVETERTKKLREHIKQFTHWEKKFRDGKQGLGDFEQAVFEISKMPEEDIFQKLVAVLKESETYYLKETQRNAKANEFYHLMISAFGRLENPKAGPFLLNVLSAMVKKMKHIHFQKRAVADIQYMTTLAKALSNAKAKNVAEALRKMRWEMGKDGRFWENTEDAFQRLARLDGLTQRISISATDFYTRGLYKLETNEFRGAIVDFTKAIELDPKFFDAFHRRGWAKDAIGDFAGALEDYNFLLELNPKSPDLYNDRGKVKISLNDYRGALKDFDRALNLNPNFIVIYANRGMVKNRLGNVIGALEDLNKAIELNPQFAGAYANRGNIKYAKGDFQGALKDYEQAIQFNPKNSQAYGNRGVLKIQLGFLNEAMEDFTACILLDPQNYVAYRNRGNAKFDQQDFKGALEDYNEVLKLQPKNIETYLIRGETYLKLKKFKLALKDFNFVLTLNSTNKNAYWNRGLAYFYLEQYSEAFADFQQMQQREVDFFQSDLFQNITQLIFGKVIQNYRKKEYKEAQELLTLFEHFVPKTHPIAPKIQKMLKQLEGKRAKK